MIVAMAQECHGVAQTLLGQSLCVLPKTTALDPFFESTVERFSLEVILFERRFAEPPVPPPRLENA
jgi:hypothetical protein